MKLQKITKSQVQQLELIFMFKEQRAHILMFHSHQDHFSKASS